MTDGKETIGLLRSILWSSNANTIAIVPSDADKVIEESAEMLEFFFGQMQEHSPKMDGSHSYRFLSSGWPMTHCIGSTPEEAVRNAIAEIKRFKNEVV